VEIWSGKSEQALAVPSSAIVDEGGQSVVFVQRGGESFERRVVAIGIRDGDQVEIFSGLKPAERVVTRGAYLVRLSGASPKAAGEGHVH
jgi:membrane fusion protein, heavy metal efflux system